MALDKQSTAKERPVAKPNAPSKTPSLAGRGPPLARDHGSPASDVSPSLCRDARTRGGTPSGMRKEEVSTPVKAFLSSNITPRSGSRKARLKSESPTPSIPTATPNGTPGKARPVSMIERWDDGLASRAQGASALGMSGIDVEQDERVHSVISDGSGRRSYTRPLSVQSGPVDKWSRVESPDDSPMFFRADEFTPRVPSKPEQQRPVLKTVFSGYTQDGWEEDAKSRSSLSTSPAPADNRPKFFRANSSNDAISPPLKLAKGPLLRRTPQPAPFQVQTPSSQQRAASPLKDEITARDSSLNDPPKETNLSRKSSLNKRPKEIPPARKTSLSSPRRHTRLVSNSSITIEGPGVFTADTTRRSSLNTPSPQRLSHAKAANVSLDTTPSRRNSLAASDFSPSSPTQLYLKPRPRPASIAHGDFGPLSITSPPSLLAHAAPTAANNPSAPLPTSPQPPAADLPGTPPLSPTRPTGQSRLDHMNELAANARRERKVLDLEISNSSLLAINRTLEREMRKQKDELRRMRRTTQRTAASRVVSGATNSTGRASMLSGVATTEDGELYSDELSSLGGFDDDDDMRSLTSSTSSPPPDRTSFARDTKRLQFEFSRHRALLVDSQKLNQALKRCLDTTESLISDGKKALEYKPQISEAEQPLRGGIVLAHEDEDEDSPRQGLLSPGISRDSQSNPWDSVLMDDVTTSINELQSQLPWHDEGIGETDPATAVQESRQHSNGFSPWAVASPGPEDPDSETPNAEPSTPATLNTKYSDSRPQTPPTPQHVPLPPSSPNSPSKTGWDAIKADVKTPDGLRGLGLGGYLQSLGGGFGGLVAGNNRH